MKDRSRWTKDLIIHHVHVIQVSDTLFDKDVHVLFFENSTMRIT